jgi:hypothetical protein
VLSLFPQRAADGGMAAENIVPNGLLRATRTGAAVEIQTLSRTVCEPGFAPREQRQAYVSMR